MIFGTEDLFLRKNTGVPAPGHQEASRLSPKKHPEVMIHREIRETDKEPDFPELRQIFPAGIGSFSRYSLKRCDKIPGEMFFQAGSPEMS